MPPIHIKSSTTPSSKTPMTPPSSKTPQGQGADYPSASQLCDYSSNSCPRSHRFASSDPAVHSRDAASHSQRCDLRDLSRGRSHGVWMTLQIINNGPNPALLGHRAVTSISSPETSPTLFRGNPSALQPHYPIPALAQRSQLSGKLADDVGLYES